VSGRPVTLVTGASAGLGVEFARLCAARGDELVLVARRREPMEALAAQLGKAHVFAADLAAPGAAARLVRDIEALGFEIETLINNAGFGLAGRFEALPIERQTAMIDLNVRVLTELCRLVLPGMQARRRGFLLNVASTAAFQPGPNMAVYYASKAFVLSFTEALHHELKGSGIRVSALCPGPTESEFSDVAESHSPKLAKLAVQPRAVAEAGLAGVARNKAIVVPGRMNKVTSQAPRFLPRGVMRRIVAAIKA
jgi:short-subunit dehydrogenase